ncbi:hypothetical protein FISHEDRAFT_59345 [Fistulina hepatica ATCC 64428]|uniref:BHLH domain-containing protein n=1 Tax=Fistulina hepatica ATCC 64428 TaxID=1128425 RepID=A0A0D7AA81_9AGAR|nr:hypothetical protein FISHEDRAFT_59345 [Fistulina hepatica ATCC 64428]
MDLTAEDHQAFQNDVQKDIFASLFAQSSMEQRSPISSDSNQTNMNRQPQIPPVGAMQQQSSVPMHSFQGSEVPMNGSNVNGMQSVQSMSQQLLVNAISTTRGLDNIFQGMQPPVTNAYNPQVLLEQQLKLSQLQQLQQLQNQIFQQQMALLSGQALSTPMASDPPIDGLRETSQFEGLPTPGPSAELRAQQSDHFVSPMILGDYNEVSLPRSYHDSPLVAHPPEMPSQAPRGSTSAPAHIAFSMASDLDFDVSPLTSPWLGASHHRAVPNVSSRKRRTSIANDVDDVAMGKPSRKKMPPAVKRAAANQSEATNDTPSPVDLSMPPPALPPSSSSGPSPNLTPITPASLMNLPRYQVLPPPPATIRSNSTSPTKEPSPPDDSTLPSAVPTSTSSRSTRNSRKKASSQSSTSLKAILPAGGPSTSTIQLQGPQPVVRKSSHKDAEQKRRDSMKSTFDDLRGLLPPIPLPGDAGEARPPMPPGALPPRGPPKAGGEGPNKGVSKLQLLMCGNEYIRLLQERIRRRDDEIALLRKEIRRLRDFPGVDPSPGDTIDLEKDMDVAEQSATFGYGLGRALLPEGEDEGDEDGDE